MNSEEEIIQVFQEMDKFLIVGHINPDGDSLGSSSGLALALRKIGKEAFILANDAFPETYDFLSYQAMAVKEINPNFLTAIVLDCGDLRRTGSAMETVKQCSRIVNIDHHATNEQFGDLNFVDSKAAATGQILYHLLQGLAISWDKEIAISLYTAIMTDTGGFRHSNTNCDCFAIAEDLVCHGANPHKIAQHVYQNASLNSIQLLGKILATMRLACGQRIAWATVSQEMLAQTNCKMEETEEMISCLLVIRGVDVAVIFKEQKEACIRVSLRSKSEFDVSKIAQIFSGGGHKKAAGCTIHQPLAKAEKTVIAEIQKHYGVN